MSTNSVAAILRTILQPATNLSNELSTAFISLGSAVDQIKVRQESISKEVEQVRRMCRTNWIMIVNLPLPYGMSKGNAVQQLFEKLAYGKPIFDSDRDILATDMIYVNKTGGTCNLSIFLSQRHFDHVMSSVFQKQIISFNKKMPIDQKVTIGRVLTPSERCDYETSCACKRLVIKKMLEKKKVDSSSPVFFVLVEKRKLCLRIDKEYITVGDACVRFGISLDEIEEEKKKHSSTAKARSDKGASKRPAGTAVGPDSKAAKLIPLNREGN